VLQRSLHEAPVDVPAIPATVGPGEVVDWPIPISGFEELAAEETEARPPADPPAAPSKTVRKKAAPAEVPVGEEPQQ
jgi:hypothetical protein